MCDAWRRRSQYFVRTVFFFSPKTLLKQFFPKRENATLIPDKSIKIVRSLQFSKYLKHKIFTEID